MTHITKLPEHYFSNEVLSSKMIPLKSCDNLIIFKVAFLTALPHHFSYFHLGPFIKLKFFFPLLHVVFMFFLPEK